MQWFAIIFSDYDTTKNKANPENSDVVTHLLCYQRGKVITLGLHVGELKGNQRFWRFLISSYLNISPNKT